MSATDIVAILGAATGLTATCGGIWVGYRTSRVDAARAESAEARNVLVQCGQALRAASDHCEMLHSSHTAASMPTDHPISRTVVPKSDLAKAIFSEPRSGSTIKKFESEYLPRWVSEAEILSTELNARSEDLWIHFGNKSKTGAIAQLASAAFNVVIASARSIATASGPDWGLSDERKETLYELLKRMCEEVTDLKSQYRKFAHIAKFKWLSTDTASTDTDERQTRVNKVSSKLRRK